ncbi:MAG: hypothetical protein KGJ62_05330 [Armatimonadetes bacterium]|nr:hypothetical protein [Armatimonadota bacterium]MDE2207986.1 hypothetical protein [Armatimonadota bacterium]
MRLIFRVPAFSAAFLAAAAGAAPPKPTSVAITPPTRKYAPTAGIYVDAAGGKHAWNVSATHAIYWDGNPWIAAAASFQPASLATAAPSAWVADQAAILKLKSSGAGTILVNPGVPLPTVNPVALQRLISFLDANGLTYGLTFGSGIQTPLSGTVVKPAVYRYAAADGALTATWQVPNCTSAIVTLIDTGDANKIIRTTTVAANNGVVTCPIDVSAIGKVVAIIYPQITEPRVSSGSLPDIWEHFDGWRDSALAMLKQVHFGPGFRFFCDPLTPHIGLPGDTDYMIPNSPEFLLEWEAFLARRYPSVDEARQTWGLAEGDYKSHKDLARLVPLWSNDRGAPYFYDPASHQTYRLVDARESRWWADFLDFRNASIQYYMNAICRVLRHSVADVPVVYTWSVSQPLFAGSISADGCDGLVADVPADAEAALARNLAPCYAEAEQAQKRLWCSVEITAPKPASGAPTPARVTAMLTDADRAGFKGFISGSTVSTDVASTLLSYAHRVAPGAADYAPRVLFYPLNAPGPADEGFVSSDSSVLWLGAYQPGDAVDWWPSYSGYAMQLGNVTETVLTSLRGRRITHFLLADPRHVLVQTAAGTPVPVKVDGRNTLTVTLDSAPTVFFTEGQRLVPEEAASDTIVQLIALMQRATAGHVPTVDNVRPSLDRAQFAFHQKDYEQAYTFARSGLDDLTLSDLPYIWIEGENPFNNMQTFTQVASNPAASGDGYLLLDTSNAPGNAGYGARYVFDVPADGKYNFWMACTPPGPETSPIRWRLNSDPLQDVADPAAVGPLYMQGHFGWILLGTQDLHAGSGQAVTIYAVDKAPATNKYLFGIDAILITTHVFTPNGTARPLPVSLTSKRLVPSKKGRGSVVPDVLPGPD